MAWPEESIEELADDFTETSMRRDEERIQEDEQQDKPDMPFSEDF
jgi:hypothetical protein